MLLCLDVGNTCISIGVFENDQLIVRCSYETADLQSSDDFGVFLLNTLKLSRIAVDEMHAAIMCSVVPWCDDVIEAAITKYLQISCINVHSDLDIALKNQYKNPKQLGADRFVNAIAAAEIFPNQHCIIVDIGTATTVCALHADQGFLGGAILPGLRLAMTSLKNDTAQLTEVAIVKPETCLGQTTQAGMQAGIYYGQMGAIKEIISQFKQNIFAGLAVTVIGTGGYSFLYQDEKLFDVIMPDLTLQGLRFAYQRHPLNVYGIEEIPRESVKINLR